ncbi:MAG: flippase-like domain-containing protein [Anaerolineales bacterium]|nr:flippase-like domain-containing protein [Anaerolineales bacterium]
MKWFKWGLTIGLFGVLIYSFLPLLSELRQAAKLFLSAQWIWLLVAIFIQFLSYASLTWLNVLALEPFNGKIGFWNLTAVLTSMAFIQIAIPSAGLSGAALRIRLLGKFEFTPEESLFSLVIESLYEFVALVLVASLGIVVLLRDHNLSVQAIIIILVLGVLSILFIRYYWRLLQDPERSRISVAKLVYLWNRIGGRFRCLELDDMLERLTVFQSNLTEYNDVPVWRFVLATSGKVILDIATLGAAFMLFGYAISPGILLVGYGLIMAVGGLAALPGGIGMADAYIPVLFSWFGVPGAVALTAGLVYRLVAYWLVRFIGFFSWQYLERRY